MCPADVCSLWHWPGHGNCPGSTHIYLALCHSLAGSFFWDMLPIMKLSCIKTTINEVVSLLVILVPISLVFIGYIHLTVVIVHYSYASTAHLKPRSENSEEQALLLSVTYIIITHLLSSVIYSVRNKVKDALCRAVGRTVS